MLLIFKHNCFDLFDWYSLLLNFIMQSNSHYFVIIEQANSHYFVIIEQESTCQEYFTNEAESSKKKVHLDNVSLSVTCDNTEVEICSSDNITPCKRNLFESDVEQSVSVDLISPQMSSNKKEKLIKIEKDNY
ncbi:uncharacterized protein LOC109833916 isoform X2 [Asparagus officinalis]|uniref:uncharacterized protein LOC109833916 isoform X2 n=1 Tax=Asparagus officinalis TaxID=4686 RepID=UPI00098E4542|nr:uncharacterized protein LOC109833916 isoform X2 [Asparagus officinalis]